MDATGHFLVDLTGGVVAAAIGGYLARLARLTPVIGYLVAGVVIGPFTPGITADVGSLSGLGELGLILLVFSLGLGFAPSELRRVGIGPLAANVAAMIAIGLFFVALGMALDVRAVLAAWPAVLALGAILIAVRLGVWTATLRLLRFGWPVAAGLAVALLPLGEFNMVLANAARTTGRLDSGEFAGLVGATFLSIVVASAAAPLVRRPLDAQTVGDAPPAKSTA